MMTWSAGKRGRLRVADRCGGLVGADSLYRPFKKQTGSVATESRQDQSKGCEESMLQARGSSRSRRDSAATTL
ncbi:hypothetical protein Y032_0040g290 [Ancylostoma ceylanicum]|uniref:Uncharacterized protein n=1 Tax=Ancylostoma ceylanicum TaxID=53326 RepID=A0A016UGW7_9BILA|nr:hypothetical protein Y032_0040g290 [Ancylostoma ceylanicum]